jgi:hypothetical protein
MGFADHYFLKQHDFSPHLTELPDEKLQFAVVIPAYNEPDLTASLQALWQCTRPGGHVEVYIVINAPENAGNTVVQTAYDCLKTTESWIHAHREDAFRFYLIEALQMPAKHAGVGLARKIAMDEALHRFNLIDKPGGMILSFDADARCDRNYFISIEEELARHPDTNGFTIYFEHPLSGNDFTPEVYKAAAEYELHLRCVNQFLRYCGFPYAFHTVGSCFGVRASTYAFQGGMNRKQAGEDFYFLHKIIPLGEFYEINTTRIIPSPRPSDRVPFGTGAAIGKFIAGDTKKTITYAPEIFLELRPFFLSIEKYFKKGSDEIGEYLSALPECLKNYLVSIHAVQAMMEINANCRTPVTFRRRFFNWFDAFRVVKYMNFASINCYEKQNIGEVAARLLQITGNAEAVKKYNIESLLLKIRSLEKVQDFSRPLR